MISLSGRSWLIWTALAGTLVAVKFAPEASSDAAVAAPVVRTSAAGPVVRTAVAAPVTRSAAPGASLHQDVGKVSDPDEVLELEPRDGDPRLRTTFASMTWTPSQPARAVAPRGVAPQAPPPPPSAPPLPFRVLGRFEQDGKRSVFMQYNEQTVVATAGAVINDMYRVEEVTDTSVTLTYLPMGERQVLTVASAN